MKKREITVGNINESDTHFLAEAVQTASRYKSRLYISVQNAQVNLKSIMGMMTLGLMEGDSAFIEADGIDEDEAIEGMSVFFEQVKR